MYCSECKLRVADDGVANCPICQGPLRSESEAKEQPESVDFVGELAAVSAQDLGQDVKLDDKLDAYVRDDANLDFDPEVLGLKSSEVDDPAASADDIRVLADLWEKEDIGADLDGVFADTFNLEEVDSEPVVEGSVVLKPEKVAPETPLVSTSEKSTSVMPIPEVATPVPAENPLSLGLPLIVFIVLLVVGGGSWFYMQNAGVKPDNKLPREIKSPDSVPVKSKIELQSQSEPAVVNGKPVEGKVVPVVEQSTVTAVKPQPAGDETADTSAEGKPDSLTDVATGTAVPTVADSAAVEVVGVGSEAVISDTPVLPSVESLVAAGSISSSIVEKKTVLKHEIETAVDNQKIKSQSAKKTVPKSILAKEKTVVAPVKVNPAVAPAVTVATPRYVVHVGSFRNKAGAVRQLAKLQKKGFAAYEVEVDLGEKGVWQRIFVPGGASKSNARQVQEQLAKSFPQEESLVRKIKK